MEDRRFDRNEIPAGKKPEPARVFTLYPKERHWWSFNDYGAVLDTMLALKPKRVLEFGPGSSTLALIEGGATHIDTLEDAEDWAQVYEERLAKRYPSIVRLHRYAWADPLSIKAIDQQRYDLALIDGPLGTDSRGAVVRYCLDRCKAVLVPTESKNPGFREEIMRIAASGPYPIEIRETGPLSGAFALIGATKIIVPAGAFVTHQPAPTEHQEVNIQHADPVIDSVDPVSIVPAAPIQHLQTEPPKRRGRKKAGQ